MNRPDDHAEQNLPGSVYRALRHDILTLKLKPGASLLERNVAERLGVSRTPVREALHRLEDEGLVTRYPKRGMVVSELTLRDVVEAFQIREFMEPPATALAVRLLRRETLEDLLEQFRQLDDPGMDNAEKYERHNILDARMHEEIIKAVGNQRLLELMDNLQVVCTRARALGTPMRFVESTHEHEDILAALIEGDGARAEALMRRHLAEAKQRLVLAI